MSLSLLVNIGVASQDSDSSLGHVEISSRDSKDVFKDVDKVSQEKNVREIRIILKNPDDVYR